MTIRAIAVTSELHPLIKTGGLADVAGALPRALAQHGVETTTLLPAYPGLLDRLAKPKVAHRWDDLFGAPARLLRGSAAGLDLLLLDAPALFDRKGGPYADASGRDWPDNGIRFAALGRAAADIAGGAIDRLTPDILHAHDWQAGLAPAYLRWSPRPIPSVMTIHNLAFQGRFPAALFAKLGLPREAWHIDGVEYYGGVGLLKAGLQSASAITTVSPTYAAEILSPAFGMGLEGLLRVRADRLSGIVNGIDTAEWDPATDAVLAAPYSAARPGKRRLNRAALESAFGLTPGDGPLFCVISRLSWQKGIDALVDAVPELVALGGRLVLLGSGDAELERALHGLATRFPGHVAIRIGYDEPLAHLMQAGADAILIPSRFEPCGLTQLYGLRYGCVPIVARTGGLADTVIDANEAALADGVATGFQFGAEGLGAGIRRAVAAFPTPTWKTIQRNGMRADFGWGRSAARYAMLYADLLAKAAG